MQHAIFTFIEGENIRSENQQEKFIIQFDFLTTDGQAFEQYQCWYSCSKKKDYLWSKSIVDVIKNKDNIPKNGEENVTTNTQFQFKQVFQDFT